MASRVVIFLILLTSVVLANTKSEVERLFIQASSESIRFAKIVQPSKDSLAAMKDSAAKYLVRYLNTIDAREAQTLTDIFRGIGKPATPYLIAALNTDDKYQLRVVARCLAEVKDSSAIDALLKAAVNDDYTVRAEALAAVGKSGGGVATAVRLEPFLSDSIYSVRKSCVYGLGRLKSPSSIALLIKALGDPHFGVRLTAYDALVSYDSAAYSKITMLLDSTTPPEVAALALRLSGQLRIQEAEPRVKAYLTNSDPLLRGWAVWSLGRIDGKSATGTLQNMLVGEQDPFVKSQLLDTRQYIDTLSSHE